MGTYLDNESETVGISLPQASPHSGRGDQALTAIRFGEYLCQQGLLSEAQLLEALADHWSNGGTIGTAIFRQGFLAREEIERHALLYHSVDTVEI